MKITDNLKSSDRMETFFQEENLSKSSENVKPWYFIPTLYFAEGLPYIIINSVSVIMYKNMGIDNAQIALWTSLLYLPWVLKMLWSPIVESYSTTKNWIVYSQIIMAVCLGLAAISLFSPNFFFISLAILMLGAFISATNDTATDGFYLEVLDKKKQGEFAGIRPVFYRLALIFGSGFLVFLAGTLENNISNITLSWAIPLGLTALIFAGLSLYHRLILPTNIPLWQIYLSIMAEESKLYNLKRYISSQGKLSQSEISFNKTKEIFNSYFTKPHLIAIIVFILMYRFGEALLLKLNNPFLLDKMALGGLELSTQEVGLVYGTFGLLSLIIGGILGGFIIARYGLKNSILPMALTLNIPHVFYLYMAIVQPHSTLLVCLLVSLEQFGYGLGLTAFMVYLMRVSGGKYKTSHYAISTGIMALGMMLPGIVSGYLEQSVGYITFFLIVCLFTIPSLLAVFWVPKTPLDFLKVIFERERVKDSFKDNYRITISRKMDSELPDISVLSVKQQNDSHVLIVDVIEKIPNDKQYEKQYTKYQEKFIEEYKKQYLKEFWLIDLNELSLLIYSWIEAENRYKITQFINQKENKSKVIIKPLDSEIKSTVFPDLKDLTADELLIV